MNTGTVYPWLQQHCPTLLAGARRLPAVGLGSLRWLGRSVKKLASEVLVYAVIAAVAYVGGQYTMWDDIMRDCSYTNTHFVWWSDEPHSCDYEGAYDRSWNEGDTIEDDFQLQFAL